MRFRGICIDGPLKGKEVEGKLNIEIEVESLTQAPESQKKPSIPWGIIFISFSLMVLLNFGIGDPIGFTNKQNHEPPSSCDVDLPSCH